MIMNYIAKAVEFMGRGAVLAEAGDGAVENTAKPSWLPWLK